MSMQLKITNLSGSTPVRRSPSVMMCHPCLLCSKPQENSYKPHNAQKLHFIGHIFDGDR